MCYTCAPTRLFDDCWGACVRRRKAGKSEVEMAIEYSQVLAEEDDEGSNAERAVEESGGGSGAAS